MSVGSNIKNLREHNAKGKMTQEELAEKIGVTFQAVSSWERDEYLPETANLKKLAEALGVSVSAVLEDKKGVFKTKDEIYNWEHMKTFVKTTARNCGMTNTLKAVDYAVEKHEGQKRKRSSVPYIVHPLTLACHVLAMGFRDDEIIAACLLHDVAEDCGVKPDELPFDEGIQEIVRLLTHKKTTEENREQIMKEYYGEILGNPKAVLVKCVDRCHNLTNMAWGLSRERITRMILETEEYYPKLLDVLKSSIEYNDAAWLLKYQIESMLDIYKRLL